MNLEKLADSTSFGEDIRAWFSLDLRFFAYVETVILWSEPWAH